MFKKILSITLISTEVSVLIKVMETNKAAQCMYCMKDTGLGVIVHEAKEMQTSSKTP